MNGLSGGKGNLFLLRRLVLRFQFLARRFNCATSGGEVNFSADRENKPTCQNLYFIGT
jgi:hypothetical protein